MADAAPFTPPAPRLLALDALRGFDMMWILGADAIAAALAKIGGGAPVRLLAAQMEHVPWAGFHFYDLIFPLFVFMAGAAIPFSLDRMVAHGGAGRAFRRVAWRTGWLYALGLLYYGGFATPLTELRLLGVLQRLALCYGAAGGLYLCLRPRGLAVATAALLLGYWVLLTFVPVPGFGAGDFQEGHNLTNWLDAHFLPLRKWDGDHDPEGMLSTLPAIASCLLGVLAGVWLKRAPHPTAGRGWLLVAAGASLLVLGHLWGLQFPLIKKIWTSSFVLVAGGWSMLLLGGFYLVADVWKIQAWARPFAWVGSNALVIYLVSNVVDFNALSARFTGGTIASGLDAVWPGLGGLVLALVSIVLCFALCRFLHERKIFLRL